MADTKRIERLEGEVVGLSLVLEAMLSNLDVGDDFYMALKKRIGELEGIPAEDVNRTLPLRIRERQKAFVVEMLSSFIKRDTT